jgi:cation transport ATPase
MATKRKSRKRRTRSAAAPAARAPVAPPAPAPRGYARSRAKDEEARAKLKPLAPGERPAAVTVAAVVAAGFALANAIALAFGYNGSSGRLAAGAVVTTLVLATMAWGMWRARYWAVLGMEALLALTIIFASLSLITAVSVWAAVLMVLIIGTSGTLFWFLIKAMARLQMPERPGTQRTG